MLKKSRTGLGAMVIIATLSIASASFAVPNTGGGDGVDCYTRITRACNDKYPGKDMGDAAYASCINAGLDYCDEFEPARTGGRPSRWNGAVVDGAVVAPQPSRTRASVVQRSGATLSRR